MGQRTRMGRTGSNRPISRAEYRQQAWERDRKNSMRAESDMATGELPRDDAGGRARFAANHAAATWVKYERTEQGTDYVGPKTVSPRAAKVRADLFAPTEAMIAVLAMRARLRSR